jgi:hypothetical protein
MLHPTELTFELVERLRSHGRWESIFEIVAGLHRSQQAIRQHLKFLESQGIVVCYSATRQHRYRFHILTPEFESALARWEETRLTEAGVI